MLLFKQASKYIIIKFLLRFQSSKIIIMEIVIQAMVIQDIPNLQTIIQIHINKMLAYIIHIVQIFLITILNNTTLILCLLQLILHNLYNRQSIKIHIKNIINKMLRTSIFNPFPNNPSKMLQTKLKKRNLALLQTEEHLKTRKYFNNNLDRMVIEKIEKFNRSDRLYIEHSAQKRSREKER